MLELSLEAPRRGGGPGQGPLGEIVLQGWTFSLFTGDLRAMSWLREDVVWVS